MDGELAGKPRFRQLGPRRRPERGVGAPGGPGAPAGSHRAARDGPWPPGHASRAADGGPSAAEVPQPVGGPRDERGACG